MSGPVNISRASGQVKDLDLPYQGDDEKIRATRVHASLDDDAKVLLKGLNSGISNVLEELVKMNNKLDMILSSD